MSKRNKGSQQEVEFCLNGLNYRAIFYCNDYVPVRRPSRCQLCGNKFPKLKEPWFGKRYDGVVEWLTSVKSIESTDKMIDITLRSLEGRKIVKFLKKKLSKKMRFCGNCRVSNALEGEGNIYELFL